ncbi:hypothetical protein BH10PLA1_BH10PLA1_01980 [soil metagenome]
MSEPHPTRRHMVSILTAALMALMGGLILTPAVAFVTAPLRRRRSSGDVGDGFSDAGTVDAIPAGTWTLVPIEIVRQDGWAKSRQTRSVFVLVSGSSAGEVKALSPICPHLGCPVGWSSEKSQFRCPCHGGTFDKTGVLVGGPPPRGMDSLECQIRDGHLWIRWQDFRISVPERIAIEV